MARNWEPGDVIMGRYRLVSLLGQGGMGSVWRAEHTELKNQVAIKLLDGAIASNPEMIARFLREARAAASLQNRHVIRIFDHGVEDGDAFMVMELLEGETIGERLERLGTMSVDDTIKFMCQVMRAMGSAHDAGIIHRDLKPDNIFITSDDDGEFAKVLDFGVAKVANDLGATNGVKTQTGMMLGTPFYMSPEQAKAKKVDARTDVWALAVITYECLTGKRPFTGDSFADLVLTLCNAPIPLPSSTTSVPMGFDEWFVRGTQRDVDRRFADTRTMAAELLHLANSPMTGARFTSAQAPSAQKSGSRMSLTTGQSASVGVDRRTIPTSSSHNGIWYGATAALVLATAGLGVYVWKQDQVSRSSQAGSPDQQSTHDEMAEAVPSPEPAPRAVEDKQLPTGLDVRDKKPKTIENVDEGTPAAPTTRPEERAPAPRAEPTERASPRQIAEKREPESQPAPATESTTGSVPVVDSNALPPTEWDF